MELLKGILEKIEAPLVFSSKDSYRHLPLIKDFAASMTTFIKQLEEWLSIHSSQVYLDIQFRDIISEFKEIILGFDKLSLEDKKKRIEKLVLLLNKLKQRIPSSSTVDPEIQDEQSFHKLNNYELSFKKLSLPIQFIKGVGPKIALLLEKKGIKTVEDLLYFVPRKYEDRRSIKDIKSVSVGVRETVIGCVVRSETRAYGKRRVYEVTINDSTGLLTAKWFKGNYAYLKNIFKKGMRVIMSGEINSYLLNKDMVHPDFEILNDDESEKHLLHFKRIVPVYSETEGLHQKLIRRITAHVVDNYSHYIVSPIPQEICESRLLGDIHDAIRSIHFPAVNEDIEAYNEMRSAAHRRIIYDEFFFLQLGIALKRKGYIIDKGIEFTTRGKKLQKFYKILSFSLTNAQKKVIREIETDMEKPCSMNRLLQGDVGCGKTVVSMAAMITACENGYQAAIMAPTEILAEQHYKRIKDWADQLDLKVALLTGGMKNTERKKTGKFTVSNNVGY